MSSEKDKSPPVEDKGKEHGEGNYAASREYNERTRKFMDEKGESIEQLAEDAEQALDGDEGAELREADEKGKSRAKH